MLLVYLASWRASSAIAAMRDAFLDRRIKTQNISRYKQMVKARLAVVQTNIVRKTGIDDEGGSRGCRLGGAIMGGYDGKGSQAGPNGGTREGG